MDLFQPVPTAIHNSGLKIHKKCVTSAEVLKTCKKETYLI